MGQNHPKIMQALLMRILHTADLHLGRQLNGMSLEADHGAVLSQIIEALKASKADLLIIAGDLYDRAAPPAPAVRQFNAFVARVQAETSAAIALIAGNHDSGDRIDAMAAMNDPTRHLVRGVAAKEEPALILSDAHGKVAISGLPFTHEYAARVLLDEPNLHSPQDVLKAQLAAARAAVPQGARWVVIAHGFVAGGAQSDSERSLTRVGGAEQVHYGVFDGADYVALGHLHRPQAIRTEADAVKAPVLRYSGAPLAFGIDEEGDQKSMTLVDLGAPGMLDISLIAFKPLRQVRTITGRHADLLGMPPCDDFVHVILTDQDRVLDAMRRLRTVFPNACGLNYQSDIKRPSSAALLGAPEMKRLARPLEVVEAFSSFIRDTGLREAERPILAEALDQFQREQTAS